MKVLITGVAGFIGSHLADSMLSQGHRVTGVDFLEGEGAGLIQTHRLFRIDKDEYSGLLGYYNLVAQFLCPYATP